MSNTFVRDNDLTQLVYPFLPPWLEPRTNDEEVFKFPVKFAYVNNVTEAFTRSANDFFADTFEFEYNLPHWN